MRTGLTTSFILITFLVPANAYAYLDPGTGGMAVQALLAAIAAGLVALKAYWGRITGLFRKKDGDD